MTRSPKHIIAASKRLSTIIKAFDRQLCSCPILLDLAAIEHIDNKETQRQWLSEQERQRLSGFTFPKRRKEWIAGRICAKIAIEEYIKRYGHEHEIFHPTDLSIISSDTGRPYAIVDKRSGKLELPDVSISHSRGLAFALAAKPYCGVDIQQANESLVRVKERFCTAQEEGLLLSLVTAQKPLMQLSLLWAAKEAAQKALSIVDMPGFLDLELTCIDKTSRHELFFIFNRYHRHTRLASTLRVLVTDFKDYGLGICIP